MLKKLVKEELKSKNFKLTEEEYKRMQKKADEYAGGNLSEWLRFASLNHVPSKKDLVEAK